MSMATVESALIKAFVDANFFAQALVQWPNVKFEPPVTGAWAAVYFLPSQPFVATLGTGGEDEVPGILQIDLNFPPNSGTKGCNDKYEAIKNVFTAGARFAYSGQEVVIRSCGRSQGRIVNNFYCTVVTIAFYAYVNR